MSPIGLELLLHYYYSPEDHKRLAVMREITDGYLADGIFMLRPEDEKTGGFYSTYKLTDKGTTWVEMILATPQPIQIWIDPRTEAVHE